MLPLATALAALMRPGPGGRPGLKIALIRRVQASAIDRARLSLIVNVIESYLRLDEEELRAFREQLRVEGDETVEATELTWAEEMIQKGEEQGREQGREEGREEGTLEAKREIALLQLRVRFGPLDAAVQRRIEVADGPALDRLLAQLLEATTLGRAMDALD